MHLANKDQYLVHWAAILYPCTLRQVDLSLLNCKERHLKLVVKILINLNLELR